MRNAWMASLLAATLLASPAVAQNDKAPAKTTDKSTEQPRKPAEKPLVNRDPTAEDVAKTPITDLNLEKQEIPPSLQLAVEQPYSLSGLRTCARLTAAVEELDGYLGPDMDLPQKERERINAGRVAKSVVSSFIPFRFLIREVSGANDQEKRVQAAVQAGIARRGFLKGVGAQRGCRYPATPAPAAMVAARKAELLAAKQARAEARQEDKDDKDKRKDEVAANSAPRSSSGVTFVSQPVVQKLP